MKRLIATALCTLALSAPVQAQDADGSLPESMDLLDRGMRMLLREMLEEMTPAMRELEDALRDLSAYHPPEILPNGDIIIRRKDPLPVDPDAPEVGDGGEVEL